MDLNDQDLDPNAQAVFFIIGIEFLKSIETSPIAKKILVMLNNFCQKPNKLIGLIFPSLNINPQINLIEKFAPIFGPLGIGPEPSNNKQVENFITLANAFLTRPPESRPLQYHTTLSQPHNGTLFYSSKIKQLLNESLEFLKALPIAPKQSEEITNTMPYGIYWFNPIKQNHVFISNQTILSFCGIMESFHFCPSDFTLRKEMLTGIRDMINQIPTTKALDNFSTSTQSQIDRTQVDKTQANSIIENFGSKITRNNSYPLRKTAWMELNIFEPIQLDSITTATNLDSMATSTKTDNTTTSTNAQQDQQNAKIKEQQTQQDQLINFITKSKLDALWISLNPNMFYSPIARKADKEKVLLETISLFTKKLKLSLDNAKQAAPKILIGFEITNNIYEPNLPKPCAHDAYDNTYNDIPDPLDQNFWNNEVEMPIEKLVNQWNNPEIGNGIPISGIMIDLEMYCRKTTGTFFSTMGFNNKNFNLFLHKNNLPTQQMKISEMVQFLIDKKMATQYFEFLENQAIEIGHKLKQSFDKKINDCIIACYMPNILINWFYKGLYQGLNTQENPLHLFSFNSEYLNHQKWFDDNKINATHSSVLLLSKIIDKKSYELINNILDHHNGVWFNRYSRLVEPKSKDWTAVEKPQIPQEQYPDFIEYIGQVK
jgi:hypothetical protein